MKLTDREWKEFNFIDIFIIRGGFYNKKPPLENNKGNIPFLGAVDGNNGITEFYTLNNIAENSKVGYGKNESLSQKIYQGNCICVTNNGSVGYAYYQKHIFTCSHDINPLYLKDFELTENIAMFLIRTVEQQKGCFKYSRKWRPKRMKKSKFLLPVNNKNKPDYQFMEDYIKEIMYKKRQKYIDYAKSKLEENNKEIIPLHNKKWKEFFVVDIFPSIQRGKRLIKDKQVTGSIPYISSSAMNNGVDNFIQYDSSKMRKYQNCLSIANSGSVGASFYEPFEYIASDHVTHLKNDNFNKNIYLFISIMTNRWSQKYNFNREINDPRISREKILLPVNNNSEPDYTYMEQYTNNIMLQKYHDYLEYAEKAV